MSLFREMLVQDLSTFFNPDEFGEEHDLDGNLIIMVLEEDDYNPREQFQQDIYNASEGIFQTKKRLHMRASDFEKPVAGQLVHFDGEPFYVGKVSESGGVLSFDITANEA